MDIRGLAQKYMDATGTTRQALAEEIGYSRTTVARYLDGQRTSDALERELETYLAARDYTAGGTPAQFTPESAAPLPALPELYPSRDATGILGLCSQCQEEAIPGIITGNPGRGKTHTLQYYAGHTANVAYVRADETMGKKDLVKAIERSLGIPRCTGTVTDRTAVIADFFRSHPGYLLIVDEADKLINRLSITRIEVIRTIIDTAPVGVIMAGEPPLEVLIKTYDQRLADRTVLHIALGGLTDKEVRGYVTGYDIAPDAMAALVRRACDKSAGCFRRLDRTMRNIQRLITGAGDRRVTMPVLEQASSMMLL